MKEIKYKPIGIIHSPFGEPKGTPIQSTAADGIDGIIELFPEFAEGIEDIEGFSHIILIYHFHLSKKSLLKVKPYMDNKLRGVFSTRVPSRPNSIGISIVRLIKVEENKLYVKDIDVVDGTPLLDIKPYVPEFDIKNVEKIGWLKKNVDKLNTIKDDGRFVNK
jgi:tRNA-Thr(GGU) m(6)t(6)A37 methyltransferase TsaA